MQEDARHYHHYVNEDCAFWAGGCRVPAGAAGSVPAADDGGQGLQEATEHHVHGHKQRVYYALVWAPWMHCSIS